jgi:acetyltransferase-like isoleucine patch superfamily enzyme
MRYLFHFVLNIFSVVYNYILFKIYRTEYVSFPKIYGKINIRGRGKIIIGENCIFTSSIHTNPVGLSNGCFLYSKVGAIISIGNNVGISNSLIFAFKKVLIGDNVLIGGGCQIYDTDFHSIDYDDRILSNDLNVKSRSVVLEFGCFIGANTKIMKGVRIGEKSVVGANSVVTKDVPGYQIWAGNPAVFIKNI